MENTLKLETPHGEIKAKIIEEPNYPAINIYINDELAVIVEYNAIKNCFSVYTYDNNSDEPLQNITWDV